MKMRSALLLILGLGLLVFVLDSCSSLGNQPKGFISGTLLDSCGGAPIADATIEYWKNPEDSEDLFTQHFSEEVLLSTKTDSLGFFQLEIIDIPDDASIRVKKKNISTYLATGFIWPTDDEDLELDSLLMYGFNFPYRIAVQNKSAFTSTDEVVIKFPTGHEVSIDSVKVLEGETEVVHTIPVNFYALVYNKEYNLDERMYVGKFKVEWHLASGEESKWFYIYEPECSKQDTGTVQVKYW